MGRAKWGSLPKPVRVGAAAFAMHALFLLVDLIFFGAAHGGGRPNSHFWQVLRIVACCLFAWSLLQRTSKPWLIGALAFTAFLIGDLLRLAEVFAGPPLENAQRLLTVALLFSLLVGIGASWWSSVKYRLPDTAA
jgi:hypothetical protein